MDWCVFGVKYPAHCGKVDVISRGCTELQFSQMGYYYITVIAPLPSTTIDQECTKLRLGLQATHTCDDRIIFVILIWNILLLK